jgi:thiol-disulfide isomerase/thioredoxin
MKHIASLTALLLLSGAALMAQGIEFFHGTWEEALEKAKAEEKVIFVDAYAEWCGPCKRMASTVFPDEKVGAFYNRHFINMKIDMEKGMGLEFRKKFPVSAYPTLFFIDGEEELVQQSRGAKAVDGLIELGQRVLEKADNSEEYAKEYEAGERDPEFVYKYVKALNRTGKSSLRVANEYFDTDPDLSTEFNLRFLFEAATEADSKLFTMMTDRRDAIELLVGKAAFDQKVYEACKATANKAAEFKSEFLLEEAQSKMKDHYSKKADAFELETNVAYYRSQREADAYAKACKKYAKKGIDKDAEALYDLALEMVEYFKGNPDVMKEAEDIAKAATKQGGEYLHFLAYAEILRVNGKPEDALKAAEEALERAQEKGSLATRTAQKMVDLLQAK